MHRWGYSNAINSTNTTNTVIAYVDVITVPVNSREKAEEVRRIFQQFEAISGAREFSKNRPGFKLKSRSERWELFLKPI
jgi:hypothetical protein